MSLKYSIGVVFEIVPSDGESKWRVLIASNVDAFKYLEK